MGTVPPPKPPGLRRVGLRVRVQAEHAEAAAARFAAAGFQVIHREHRFDGAVSFWFSKQDAGRMQAIVTVIPVDFYALRAVVGTVR